MLYFFTPRHLFIAAFAALTACGGSGPTSSAPSPSPAPAPAPSPSPTPAPSPTPTPSPSSSLSVDQGFAGFEFDLTGGAGGDVVVADTGDDIIAALDSAESSGNPVIIYVDGTITQANSSTSGDSIDIRDIDNVSIIGVEDRGEFDGIGLHIARANNIIIQNLSFHHVISNPKDAISIEGFDDGSSTSHIWIDHNELYSTLAVDKDFYDGLIDTKNGASHITISYNYMHDHWKTSLHGSSESEEPGPDTERFVTFHHNHFENLHSRVPLFRHGKGHIYNNYFNEIESTAINSRIGAEILIENNVFENTQNPIVSFYSETRGYWNVAGNIFGEGVTWTSGSSRDIPAGPDVESTTSYTVPYEYTLDDANSIKAYVIENAGVGVIDQSGLVLP
jgi:pectate lyase